jgi:hypothetical protein
MLFWWGSCYFLSGLRYLREGEAGAKLSMVSVTLEGVFLSLWEGRSMLVWRELLWSFSVCSAIMEA